MVVLTAGTCGNVLRFLLPKVFDADRRALFGTSAAHHADAGHHRLCRVE